MAKIMIVDDEMDIAELMEKLLQRAGYQTLVAGDGKKALELLEKEKPDLIIMDLIMPEVDGISAIEQLQNNKLTRDIPVILMSGKTPELDLMKGLIMGPAAYIEKPFDNQKLLNVVHEQLKSFH